MKYESCITKHSKDMNNVYFLKVGQKGQGQGQRIENCGTNRKVFS
jgi:hypothetical protein